METATPSDMPFAAAEHRTRRAMDPAGTGAAAVGLSRPAAPIAGPAAVIATGASKAFVDQACADAAKALAAPAAVPVSTPKVAVPVPAA
jgi:hypothetical protein